MHSAAEDLINRIVAASLSTADPDPDPDLPIIYINNVAEYLYAHKDQLPFDVDDLPAQAPPWPSALFYHRVYDGAQRYDNVCLMCGFELKAGGWLTCTRNYVILDGPIWPFGESFRLINADGSVRRGGLSGQLSNACREVGLDTEAAILDSPPDATDRGKHASQDSAVVAHIIGIMTPSGLIAPPAAQLKTASYWIRNMNAVINLALTFTHCKNVEITTINSPRSMRRRAKRAGVPAIRFSVLNITAMRKNLEPHMSERQDILRALHICRGHFKDYRQRGIFGKLKGVYWWNLHTRGTADAGRIVKDYSIAPKDDPL